MASDEEEYYSAEEEEGEEGSGFFDDGISSSEEEEEENLGELTDGELQRRFMLGLLPGQAEPVVNKYAKQMHQEGINETDKIQSTFRGFQVSEKLPWNETFLISTPLTPGLNVDDDFQREAAFIQQAMTSADKAMKLFHKFGIPYNRPDDYFAETVKTEDHMRRVRQKLLEKSKAIEASEQARRNRELKKLGKRIQTEVLQKRQQEKKKATVTTNRYKKDLENRMLDTQENAFDVTAEEEEENNNKKGGKGKNGAKGGALKKINKKREMKNEKYGFKIKDKRNTHASLNDFSSFDVRGHRQDAKGPQASGRKGPHASGRKGPRVNGGKVGKRGGPNAKKAPPRTGAQKRPGKARRQQAKHQGRN